jgi:hypothetical protein
MEPFCGLYPLFGTIEFFYGTFFRGLSRFGLIESFYGTFLRASSFVRDYRVFLWDLFWGDLHRFGLIESFYGTFLWASSHFGHIGVNFFHLVEIYKKTQSANPC